MASTLFVEHDPGLERREKRKKVILIAVAIIAVLAFLSAVAWLIVIPLIKG